MARRFSKSVREANKIWERVKVGEKLPKPLPCPICSSTELYTGHIMCMELGIECKKCGLELARGYPDKLTTKMAKDKAMSYHRGDGLNGVDLVCLWIAILDWNNRK